MKLSEYSKLHNITYKTAWNRFKLGKIENAYLDESGHVIIKDEEDNNEKEDSSVNKWTEI